MQITVLNRKSGLSDPLPGATRVYVGRPSVLGNPFAMRSEADRDHVVRDYRSWLQQHYRRRGPERQGLEHLLQLALNGPLELVCWCAPLGCHADVIREALLGMAKTRGLL